MSHYPWFEMTFFSFWYSASWYVCRGQSYETLDFWQAKTLVRLSHSIYFSVISIALFHICSRNDQKIYEIWKLFDPTVVMEMLLSLCRGWEALVEFAQRDLVLSEHGVGCCGAEQGRNSAVVPQQRKSCLLLYLRCNN